MKFLPVILASILSLQWCVAEEIRWTYSREEGEDASSSHYYFYQASGDAIMRIRWVWNGGAQNPPKVREYLLEAKKITFREFVGKREAIPALIAGKEAEIELKEEYSLSRGTTKNPLVSSSASELSEKQRLDLATLIRLLSWERKTK